LLNLRLGAKKHCSRNYTIKPPSFSQTYISSLSFSFGIAGRAGTMQFGWCSRRYFLKISKSLYDLWIFHSVPLIVFVTMWKLGFCFSNNDFHAETYGWVTLISLGFIRRFICSYLSIS
jgi:hypothetical protein